MSSGNNINVKGLIIIVFLLFRNGFYYYYKHYSLKYMCCAFKFFGASQVNASSMNTWPTCPNLCCFYLAGSSSEPMVFRIPGLDTWLCWHSHVVSEFKFRTLYMYTLYCSTISWLNF